MTKQTKYTKGLLAKQVKKIADREAKKAVKKHNKDPKAHSNMK